MGIFSKDEAFEEAVEADVAITTETEVEEEDETGDFTVEGVSYIIGFNQKRIRLYENGHKPIMASFIQNGGAFSLSELQGLLAYGLRREGGAYVNPRKGMEMAERLIDECGYVAVFERVTEALERDCGFLFK